jgi:hypothetical protein
VQNQRRDVFSFFKIPVPTGTLDKQLAEDPQAYSGDQPYGQKRRGDIQGAFPKNKNTGAEDLGNIGG